METNLKVKYARCCRWWPVFDSQPMGRCQICNVYPIVNYNFTKNDYAEWEADNQ